MYRFGCTFTILKQTFIVLGNIDNVLKSASFYSPHTWLTVDLFLHGLHANLLPKIHQNSQKSINFSSSLPKNFGLDLMYDVIDVNPITSSTGSMIKFPPSGKNHQMPKGQQGREVPYADPPNTSRLKSRSAISGTKISQIYLLCEPDM